MSVFDRIGKRIKRTFADPHPHAVYGPRPLSIRFVDGIVFASPARRWL